MWKERFENSLDQNGFRKKYMSYHSQGIWNSSRPFLGKLIIIHIIFLIFSPNMVTISEPLYGFLHKDINRCWTIIKKHSFCRLKYILSIKKCYIVIRSLNKYRITYLQIEKEVARLQELGSGSNIQETILTLKTDSKICFSCC